ncbi:hypothetical protein J6590_045854 [Homalodisca vitripennis]|nr:hypothetical protein J6590_045854 [Homalodisca vitripennis]
MKVEEVELVCRTTLECGAEAVKVSGILVTPTSILDRLEDDVTHGQGVISGNENTDRDHFWLDYTFQLNPPQAMNRCVTSIWATLWMFKNGHITNRKFRHSGVHRQFDRSSLLWEKTVGVDGVCSLTSEVLASLTKGMPPRAYFDWRGWFRAGLPFFRGDMTLSCSALILHGSR